MPIDANSLTLGKNSITKDLTDGLLTMIRNGDVKSNEELPTTKALAHSIGSGDRVVLRAYNELIRQKVLVRTGNRISVVPNATKVILINRIRELKHDRYVIDSELSTLECKLNLLLGEAEREKTRA